MAKEPFFYPGKNSVKNVVNVVNVAAILAL